MKTVSSTPALRGASFVPLPGARKEIDAISEFFEGDFLVDQQASEQLFKNTAGQYQILHLAMHGVADKRNPTQSRLMFTPQDDNVEDDTLYTYELYNMKLLAEMVVLSACGTGEGKYIDGEGIMSLAHAFMYAGSASVVQSMWNTEDESSAKLMTYFYESLAEGHNKSEALQQAKLKYLERHPGAEGHPFYWAGFLLNGDASPIINNNDTMLVTGLLILLVFALIWFGIKARKRKNNTQLLS